jgi:hypothetical protein
MSLYSAYYKSLTEELQASSGGAAGGQVDIEMLAFVRAAANQGRLPKKAEEHHVIE